MEKQRQKDILKSLCAVIKINNIENIPNWGGI